MSSVPPPLFHEGGGRAGPLERVEEVKWTAAGRGVRGENCGDLKRYICPECQRVVSVTKACMLRSCPDCAGPWASKEASITKSRMERARVTYRSRLHHVMLSFEGVDIDEWKRSELQNFRKECYNILCDAGADGGGVIIHPWRQSLEDTRAGMGDYTVRALHVHAFVVGTWIAPGDEVFRRRGIILKRIGELKFYKQYKYVFEHCGVSPSVHSITWFGNMSYRNFPKKDNEKRSHGSTRAIECPDCRTMMEPFSIYDSVSQDMIGYSGNYG